MDLIIITGAGRGIGKSVAKELGKSKAFILCISKSSSCINVANEIKKSGGNAEGLMLDLEDYLKVEKGLLDWLKDKDFKKISLILAAAILGPGKPFENINLQDWDICHKINILGNLAVIKTCLPFMLKNKSGKIVAFSGGGAAYANPVFPAYSASKTAFVRIIENLHEELKDKGDFSLVCFGPGTIETDMFDEYKSRGGIIKDITSVTEPVNFIKKFINSKTCNFSGRFVHVKNNWNEYLDSDKKMDESFWKLRRIE